MKSVLQSWPFWALLSAVFAALTNIFAKVGVETVSSDFATFIRTLVVVFALLALLTASGQWQQPTEISGRSYIFLVLSGLATGASWLCYFRALKLGDAARVAPLDKLSVVLVAVFGVAFLGERLSGAGLSGATARWVSRSSQPEPFSSPIADRYGALPFGPAGDAARARAFRSAAGPAARSGAAAPTGRRSRR